MTKESRSFNKDEVLNMFFDKIHSGISKQGEGKSNGRDVTAAVLKAIDSEDIGDPYVEIVSVRDNADIGRTFSMIWNWSEEDKSKFMETLSPTHRLLFEKIKEKAREYDSGIVKTPDELAGSILELIDNGFIDASGNEHKFETTVIGVEEEKQIAIGNKKNYYETERMELTGSLASGYRDKFVKTQEKEPVKRKGFSMKDVLKNALGNLKLTSYNINPEVLFASGKMNSKDDKGENR